MSGFSADWLALREAADTRARDANRGLLDALPSQRAATAAAAGDGSPAGHRRVVDLGAGTGANFRYLHPRLGGAAEWTLVDHDAELLERARDLADANGRVETAVVDLATGLESLHWPEGGLVTGSALLDLVSARWLGRLATRCRAARTELLFALTYDGRVHCRPVEPDDGAVIALVNLHQRTDKGFGPALGPAAAGAAAAEFSRVGYRLRRARSDWHIDATEPALQIALLEGWARAASDMEPGSAAVIDAWLRRRLRHVARNRSSLSVGHEDLAGWLPG